MKLCVKCNQSKELSAFGILRASPDGRATVCSVCQGQKNKEYLERNRETILRKAKDWYSNNKQRKKDYDKFSPKRKEYIKATLKQKSIAYHNYKARKANQTDPPGWELTKDFWDALVQKYDNRCCYCRQETKLTIEHVVPLSRGGKHSANNIAPACGSCNYSKSDKTPQEAGLSLFDIGEIVMTEPTPKPDMGSTLPPLADKQTHKLTEQQRAEIITKHSDGIQTMFLAKEYGVTPSSIRSLVRGKTARTYNMTVCTPEQTKQIVELRQQALSLGQIAEITKLKLSTVRYVLSRNKIRLTPEQRKTASTERVAGILNDRLAGMTRQDLANKYGMSEAGVKSILNRNGVSIPMEIRQANALGSKLKNNPSALEEMRESLTSEIVQKRNEAIAEAYTDPELLKLRSEATKKWWWSLDEENRNEYLKKRQEAFQNSEAVSNYQKRDISETTMEEHYQNIATNHGGQMFDFVKTHAKCTWMCAKGHTWSAIPNSIKSGSWCPQCANVGPSKGQLEVYQYIKSKCPDAVLGDREQIKPMELDIYVPSKRFAFEYNGLYWHSEAVQPERGRHRKKALACRNANIGLLAVFEDEWNSKPDLIKAMIDHRLGIAKPKLRASKLRLVKLAKNKEFQTFFESNHLDGHSMASFAYGLYQNEELLACMSIRTNHAGETEICRFACDHRYHINGAASRLLKAVKSAITGPLITFSNNRLGNGMTYQKLGFSLLTEQPQSYWYTDGVSKRVWRFKCRRINDPAVLANYPDVPHTETDQALAGIMSMGIFGDDRPLYRLEDYGHRKWAL